MQLHTMMCISVTTESKKEKNDKGGAKGRSFFLRKKTENIFPKTLYLVAEKSLLWYNNYEWKRESKAFLLLQTDYESEGEKNSDEIYV